jgi:hypothetical protein
MLTVGRTSQMSTEFHVGQEAAQSSGRPEGNADADLRQEGRQGNDGEEASGQTAAEVRSHLATPDGRYFVVRGRLWRMANSGLDEGQTSRSSGG